jgi:hypothetical protein
MPTAHQRSLFASVMEANQATQSNCWCVLHHLQRPWHAASPRDQEEIGGFFACESKDSLSLRLYIVIDVLHSLHSCPGKLVNRSG